MIICFLSLQFLTSKSQNSIANMTHSHHQFYISHLLLVIKNNHYIKVQWNGVIPINFQWNVLFIHHLQNYNYQYIGCCSDLSLHQFGLINFMLLLIGINSNVKPYMQQGRV